MLAALLHGGSCAFSPASTDSVTWDTTTTTLRLNSQPAVLHGMSVSCLEYACDLEGRVASCVGTLTSRDAQAIKQLLLADAAPATAAATAAAPAAGPRVVPMVRLPLTAEFYLGGSCRPNGQSYADVVASLVDQFTSAGIAVLADLHWNLRSLSQTSMALQDNSVAFWQAISSRHGSNSLVMYEIYNEPFLGYYDGLSSSAVAACFASGGCDARLNDGKGSPSGHKVEGVTAMIAAVRKNAPAAPVVLAGPGGWAYEGALLAEYLTAHGSDVGPAILNLHPYQGPYQDCDPAFDKSPTGVAKLMDALLATGRPLVMTEFGQYCCPDPANADAGYATGVCSDGAGSAGADYDGTWLGRPASYNDAVLSAATARNASWLAWAWVPGGVHGAALCAYPMINDGGTHLIGDRGGSAPLGQGSLSGAAKCDASVTITSGSNGVNASAMWGRWYAPSARGEQEPESEAK